MVFDEIPFRHICGFSNTEKIRESTYVASLLQCPPAMYQFGISSGAAMGDATGIAGFDPAVASLRMKGVLHSKNT
jgi:hypothetical protein